MLHKLEVKKSLNDFFQKIRLKTYDNKAGKDKTAKTEQILAYLEILHAKVRKYSKKRELVFIDSGAGNCYLSFLVYYFYTRIDERPIRIHCLDINERLMDQNRQLAQELQFDNMHFHACDIMKYEHSGRPDVVYTLHACDTATDKALYLGCKTNARHILSVSCCQHTIKKQMKRGPYSGLTKHRVYKEKLLYMIGDSLRALLLQLQGYEVDIVEFVSSRSTDKNVMLRAQKGQVNNKQMLKDEYEKLYYAFNVTPALADYLNQDKAIPLFKDEEVHHQDIACSI